MTLTLFNGDCLKIMKSIADKSIDLIICDLPFGCLTGGGGKEKAKRKENNSNDVIAGCAWDIKIDLEEFWKEVKRIRKDEHTPTLHFCSTKFGYDLIKSNEKEFRYDLVWNKPNAVGFLTANKKPMSSHEMIYVFSKAGANYERIDITGDFPNSISPNHKRSNVSNVVPKVKDIAISNEGKRCIKSVIDISNKKTKGGHPTAKPIELYKFLIERYSKKGDTILDPTFGSGNSGIASKELCRNYKGIEMDKGFFWKFIKSIN